nr:MAG TPA: hypothetical protein [Caudoviricetes sp.]
MLGSMLSMGGGCLSGKRFAGVALCAGRLRYLSTIFHISSPVSACFFFLFRPEALCWRHD